jgi:hypothetical protein
MSSLKVVTFTDDFQLVCGVEESADGYNLITPLKIIRNFFEDEHGNAEQLALIGWIPFTGDKTFFVNKVKVLNISTLDESYVDDYNDLVEKVYNYKEKLKQAKKDMKASGISPVDMLEYMEAIEANKIN